MTLPHHQPSDLAGRPDSPARHSAESQAAIGPQNPVAAPEPWEVGPGATHWQVQLGHFEVTVLAASEAEAVAAARRQFCRELPRLWDVIRELPAERFRIQRASP